MNTLRKVYESDGDGTVHVDVAVGAPHRKVEVVVSWEAAGDEPASDRGWPTGWFEATYGCIDDPEFVRPSQGDLEVREDF